MLKVRMLQKALFLLINKLVAVVVASVFLKDYY
jgi:hypothetical protein